MSTEIKIEDIETGKSYVAKKKKQCKNDVEKSLFETAKQFGETIAMGKLVATVVK